MARGFSHGGTSGGGGSSGGGARGFSGGGRSFGGGGGGISFGGGFRSSGSSSRRRYDDYSSHHHHHRPPRSPWRINMFGRTVVVSTGFQSFFVVGLVMLIFFGYIFFSNIKSLGYYKEDIADYKQLIQKYEDYSVEYLDIIAKAKSGAEGYAIVEGTYDDSKTIVSYKSDPTKPGIYKSHYYNGVYHYFIVYTYTSVDGTTKTDSTFTQYLIQDIQDNDGLKETIEIACKKDGKEYWAINTDYSLAKNVDYLKDKQRLASLESSYKSAQKTVAVYAVVFAVILAVVVAVVVYKVKRAQKRDALEDAKSEAEIAEAQAKAEVAEKQAEQIGRVCKYCGMDVPDGANNCPGCGSRDYE